MTTYALTMTDGSVAIMQTANGATVEDCLAKWGPGDRAKVVSWREINIAAVPDDRTFRNAWQDSGTAIEHDMDKARAIHMERIRLARDAQLAELDKEWMRQTSDPAEQAKVEAERQTLRDIPQTLDLSQAATPEELKAVWPEELPPTPTKAN